MAVEEPAFTSETKTEIYEIRKYDSILVAETLIQDDFENSGNKAFRILADYIFGNNQSKQKFEMTAPVTLQKDSKSLIINSPIIQSSTEKGFLVQFTLPKHLTLETVPKPIDSRVVIRQINPRRMAVIQYSGSWSQEHYQEKLKIFLSALQLDGVGIKGEPVFARYNSPFQLWFLRRNEIWIEVTN